MKRQVSTVAAIFILLGMLAGGSGKTAAQDHALVTTRPAADPTQSCPLAHLFQRCSDQHAFTAAQTGGWSGWSHDWLPDGCPPGSAYTARPIRTPARTAVGPAPICSAGLAHSTHPGTFDRPARSQIGVFGRWRARAMSGIEHGDAIANTDQPQNWLERFLSIANRRPARDRVPSYHASDYELYNDTVADRSNEAPIRPTYGSLHTPALLSSFAGDIDAESNNAVRDRNMLGEFYLYSRQSLRYLSEKSLEAQMHILDSSFLAGRRFSAASQRLRHSSSERAAKPAIRYESLLHPVESIRRLIEIHLQWINDLPIIRDPGGDLLHWERELEIALCGTPFHAMWYDMKNGIIELADRDKPMPKKPKKPAKIKDRGTFTALLDEMGLRHHQVVALVADELEQRQPRTVKRPRKTRLK